MFLGTTHSASYTADVVGVVATKICGKCKEEKIVSLFSLSKRNKSGFNSYCKSCDSAIGKIRTSKETLADKLIPCAKYCPTCKITKKSTEFNKCVSRKDGLDIRCKSCASQSSKIQHYKKQYGFTTDQAKHHLKNQHGNCKICSKETKLYVDHNHTTGKVRGLICNNCNTVIGHAKESVDVLLKAIDYLKEHK
jgi:hypothetical protein